jgi:flavin reductase (DIM6/NTAB) family NADH-FMN oxidoreductase RutF
MTMESASPAAMRSALSLFASGATVVTGSDEQGPVGFACQSSVSDPRADLLSA